MESFTYQGLTFALGLVSDDCQEAPWDSCDGHGPVRSEYAPYRRSVSKRPGERPLHSDRGTTWLYDWQEAMRVARSDSWGIGDERIAALTRRLGRAPTRGEIRHAAVQADFDHLAGWLNGGWCYVGVRVQLLDSDGDPIRGADESLWGVVSNDYEYHAEVARDLAHEILHSRGMLLVQRQQAWREALREAREARYWATRDVLTRRAA
jgi:hypothetical protein